MTTTDRLTDAPLLVTLPRVLKSEAETLAALCRAGAGPIHIRKPESSAAEVEGLLRDLCAAGADMDCFTLHYDEPLARRYGLGGVHLRGERIAAGAGKGLRRSCSTHGWDEVERYGPVADYVFLSPLFDSISKAGYRSAVSLEEARSRLPLSEGRVVALGGVCAENIAWARLAGFDGVASLGAVWVAEGDRLDAQATVLRFLELRRKWRAAGGCLQLISDGNMSVAEAFLRGGGRWVQLRMKDTPAGQIVGRGRELLALCRAWGALLIVNDAPELSAEIGADGVHLGQGDMAPRLSVSSAKERLSVRRPIRSSRSPGAATGRPTISASVRSAIRRPKKIWLPCWGPRDTGRFWNGCGGKGSRCRSSRSGAFCPRTCPG